MGVDGEVALDFVHTVRGNMEGFTTHCEVGEACKAHEAQGMMGHPLTVTFGGWYLQTTFKIIL